MNSSDKSDRKRSTATPDGSAEPASALDSLLGPITTAQKKCFWIAGSSAFVAVHCVFYLNGEYLISLCYLLMYPILLQMYLNLERRDRFRAFAATGQKIMAFSLIILIAKMFYNAHVRPPIALRQPAAPRSWFAIATLVLAIASFILSTTRLWNDFLGGKRKEPPSRCL